MVKRFGLPALTRRLLVLLLLQVPRPEKLFEKPLDETHVLALVRNSTRATAVRLVIGDWELEAFDASKYSYQVVRADRNSVVLWRVNDNGFDGVFIKLFFDLASQKVLKRTQFVDTGLAQVSDSEAQRALGVPAEFVKRLKTPYAPRPLPEELLAAPLPQSTYAEFSRARPGRVRDGYVQRGTRIREMIEPYQIAGDKIWFGKTFTDGEGLSGVGAIGYFDRTARKYILLRIPEIVDWSISNLLVEDDAIWAGLITHPEGADRGGGLIRHDLKSGATRKFRVDDIIYRIERRNDDLYLTTSNGIYVLKADRFTRYRVEPDISGKLVIISEQL